MSSNEPQSPTRLRRPRSAGPPPAHHLRQRLLNLLADDLGKHPCHTPANGLADGLLVDPEPAELLRGGRRLGAGAADRTPPAVEREGGDPEALGHLGAGQILLGSSV